MADPDISGDTHRRFERPVWFPSRLRVRLHWPRAGRRQWFSLGVAAMFFGTTMFMSTYSGVLADDLALAVGLVLLAQAPGHVAIPVAFGACSRLVRRFGEVAVGRAGLLLRVAIVPAFAAAILSWPPAGAPVWRPGLYAFLLVLGTLLGVGFALMQSTLPVIAAASHPRSVGRGIGGYHAAVSLGVLAGSLAGFLGLLLVGLTFSYILASIALLAGTLVTLDATRRITASPKNVQPA